MTTFLTKDYLSTETIFLGKVDGLDNFMKNLWKPCDHGNFGSGTSRKHTCHDNFVNFHILMGKFTALKMQHIVKCLARIVYLVWHFDSWNRDMTATFWCGLFSFVRLPVNSSPPSATSMRQWIGSALVQIMTYRLFSTKPLSKSMLSYCQLHP